MSKNEYDRIINTVDKFNYDFERSVTSKSKKAFNHADISRIVIYKSDDNVAYSVHCRRLRQTGSYDEYDVLVYGDSPYDADIQDSSWLLLNGGKYKVLDVIENK